MKIFNKNSSMDYAHWCSLIQDLCLVKVLNYSWNFTPKNRAVKIHRLSYFSWEISKLHILRRAFFSVSSIHRRHERRMRFTLNLLMCLFMFVFLQWRWSEACLSQSFNTGHTLHHSKFIWSINFRKYESRIRKNYPSISLTSMLRKYLYEISHCI